MSNPIPPYGVAIQDAIASGDIAKMKEVAYAAEKHIKEYGDIGESLNKLKAEIERQEGYPGGGGWVPMYAVAMQQAIKSGDLARMQTAAKNAEDQLNMANDVRSKLEELRQAIKLKSG